MSIDGGSEAAAHISRCLQNCLYSIDDSARKAAEQQLEAGVHHHGFSSTLASLATDASLTNNDIGVRQLAAVVLKQVIKKHWSAEAPKYEEPELSRDERARIQAVLPAGLSDPSSKVRTAVAMCLATISKTDPDGWPGLVENLVSAIHAQRASNTPLVHGAIRCLSLLSDDIDEQQLPQVARVLLPELLHVAADSGGGGPGGGGGSCAELRAAALSIFYDVLRSLGVMAGVYQRQVRDLLVPLVGPWLPLLCGLVAQPLSAEDPSGCPLRLLSLRSLTQLVTCFSRPLQPHLPAVMAASWGMFTGSLGIYTVHLVLEPSEGGQAGGGEALSSSLPHAEVDSEGNTIDLESMIAQLFELLMALVGLPKYAKLIRPALPEMSYLVVAYMQMTAAQASEWLRHPAQYVADEEESTFTVRVSGELLVDSMMQAFGTDAAVALLNAVERRMQEAATAQAAGQEGWWKLREAALLAVGDCVASLPGGPGALGSGEGAGGGCGGGGGDVGRGGGARHRAVVAGLRCRLQRVVDQVLETDLQGPSPNPLLVGRAMWLAARLQPLLRPDQRPHLLAAAAAGLTSNMPPPVKIGACRALASLAPRVPPEVLGPLADSLYGGLLGLMGCSGEEALNLVLESMVPLIRADPAAAARALPALSTPLLQVWARYVTDPLIAESALGVLGALARNPHCLPHLATQALPVMCGVVRQPEAQPSGLLEGCLQLLPKLVRPGSREVVAAVAGGCVGPLLALLPGGPREGLDDHTGSITHAATDLMVELLRAGGEESLTWAAPSLPNLSPLDSTAPANPAAASVSADAVFSAMLSATLRMLDPARDEYRTALAGDLAAALVLCLPGRAAVQPALGALLEGCCRKLAASNLAPLVGGLLAALAGMALVGGAAGWLEALAAIRLTPAGGGPPTSGLEAVLPVLLERWGDVRGGAAARVVAVALMELMGSRHPLLLSVMVRGKLHDLSGGVRTRRQVAAAGGEQWSSVAAAVKMAAALGEMAVEQPWLVQEAAEEEEEADSGDDEEGEEEDEDGLDEDDDEEDEEDEGQDGQDGDEALGECDAMATGSSGGGGPSVTSTTTSGLSLAGKGINQREQASLDAHIDRSPLLPADAAVRAEYGNSCDGTDAMCDSKGGNGSSRPGEALGRLHPLLLAPSPELRSAVLLGTLRQLQAGGPDMAALLAAGMELLPPRRRQQVAELMELAVAAAQAPAQGAGM